MVRFEAGEGLLRKQTLAGQVRAAAEVRLTAVGQLLTRIMPRRTSSVSNIPGPKKPDSSR